MRFIVFIVLSCFLSGCIPHNSSEDNYQRQRAKYLADDERKRAQDRADAERAAHATYQRQSTFQPDDYLKYQAHGTATLSGEAFLRTRGGDVRYAAGQSVMLIPATAYGKEFLEQDFIKAKQEIDPPLDKRLYDAIRTAQADSKGRFSFSDLPSGAYFLCTTIYWEIPRYSQYGSHSSITGGPVWQPVTVLEGEQKTIILTR